MNFIFWRLIDPSSSQLYHSHHSYNIPLVILSILNAIMASYVAFTVVDRIRTVSSEKRKNRLLLIGSTTMGFGVWAMHFTAMQACTMGFKMSYDVLLTFISIIPAMVGAYFALKTMSFADSMNWKTIQINALYMALGIGTMHYMGMEAIRAKAQMGYDVYLFIFSLVAAHVFATFSLHVRQIRKFTIGNSRIIKNLSCAVMMGLAVSCMHYTAMYAVRFQIDSSINNSGISMALPPMIFGTILFTAVLIILSTVTVSVLVDQAFSRHRKLFRNSIICYTFFYNCSKSEW